MIVEFLLTPIFGIVNFVCGLLPSIPSVADWSSQLAQIVSVGLAIFPRDVWVAVIGSVLFWWFAQIAWAIVEFAYKKIPGVE